MKHLVLILSLVYSAMLFAQTGQKNFIDQNYIEVTGKAEMEIVPNEIYLRISINEEDNKGKVSVEEKEQVMFDKLKEIGVDVEADLAVKDFASNFKDYWLKKSEIKTRKEYQLIVHNSLMLSKVFMAMEKLEISNISIERVDHSEMERFRMEVKIKAIKAAKTKAEYLAMAIDQKAGRALHIQEIENNYPPITRMNSNIVVRGYASMEQSKIMPEIEFEKIKIESMIQVYFALE